MTADDFRHKIEKFDELIKAFGHDSPNSKTLWQMKGEITEHFRAAIFLNADEKQTTLGMFETLVSTLKEKQDVITHENEEFATNAEAVIKEIEELVEMGFYANHPNNDAITSLKSKIDNAFESFKQARWPSKERRTVAWDTFYRLREKIKLEEDVFYTSLREKKNEHLHQSHQLTLVIIETIESCHPDATTNALYESLKQLTVYLISVGFTPELVEWIIANKEAEPKTPLKMKSEGLREIRRVLNENQDEITREDKHKIFATLEIISTELNKAWDLHRIEMQKKQEDWEERKKQNEFKRAEWLVKQTDFLTVLTEKLEKRSSDKVNLERILTNKKEFHSRQQARLQNQHEFLKKIIEDLADMQEKLNTAWTDSFKERMTEKIIQKELKIAEVKKDIEDVTIKLVEVEKDITDITEKVTGVDKNNEELKQKIEEVKKNLEL